MLKEKILKDNLSRANQIDNYKLFEFCSKLEEANQEVYNKVWYMGSDLIARMSYW